MTSAAGRRGYEVVADALQAAGVDVAFGLLGNSNLATVGLLSQRGVTFVGSRHESGAVSMAMGHAWATGAPTFCTVTHGPGLSNALTAIVSAVRGGLPIVLLLGDISAGPEWLAQRADHRSMLAWTGAEFVDCAEPELIAATIAVAFDRAARLRSVVVVNVPASTLDSVVPAQRATSHPEIEAADVEPPLVLPPAAADLLSSARRPVVVAGLGAVRSGAGRALRTLAERCGALLATTLPAKGLFAGDPFDLGVCGGYSDRTGLDLIAQADCIAAFGASLNGYTTDSGRLLRDKPVIHCDLEPTALGRHSPVDVPIVGDASSAAVALVASMTEMAAGTAPGGAYRSPGIARRIEMARGGTDYPDMSDDDGIDPRAALRWLDSHVPTERQVVIDLGHFSTFPSQVLSVPEAGRFLPTFGFGSVGLALATGIGAAIGRRIPTVVVAGDGGTLMSLAELETLRRDSPPLTLVVLNDDAYGAEIHHLVRHGLDDQVARFPHCDLAAVAAALGIAGHEVRTISDLTRLAGVIGSATPLVLDISVTKRAVADKFR